MGRNPLWMPALAPFFPHRGVLRAAQTDAFVIGRAANVAADTLADLVRAPLADFGGQEGVGNRGARRTDEILDPTFDLGYHAIRRGKAPNRDDRLARQPFDKANVIFLEAFGRKAG